MQKLTITVTTLGQPLENLKTYVSANRNASLREAVSQTYQRGLVRGFYQGLIPWVSAIASSVGQMTNGP